MLSCAHHEMRTTLCFVAVSVSWNGVSSSRCFERCGVSVLYVSPLIKFSAFRWQAWPTTSAIAPSQNECSDHYKLRTRCGRVASRRGDQEMSRLETTTIVALTQWLPLTRAQEKLWKVRLVDIFRNMKGSRCSLSVVVVVSSSFWLHGRGEQPATASEIRYYRLIHQLREADITSQPAKVRSLADESEHRVQRKWLLGDNQQICEHDRLRLWFHRLIISATCYLPHQHRRAIFCRR